MAKKIKAEQLLEMKKSELKKIIKVQELDVDPTDFDDVDELRAAVAEELDIELPDEDEDEITGEQLMELKKPGLKKVIKEQGLKINPDKFDDVDDLRAAIAKKLDIDLEEEEEDENGDGDGDEIDVKTVTKQVKALDKALTALKELVGIE